MTAPVRVVETSQQLQALVEEAGLVQTLALDLESNGLYVYRPRPCTVQLAWQTDAAVQVAIVDALSCDLLRLRPLLESQRPLKIVHDVAFDARLLCKEGVTLAGVRDTALCASFLGRSNTGLAALLEQELGVHVDKSLQISDWSKRPLETEALRYLAADVEHLLDLHNALWKQVLDLGISGELLEETEHRLRNACVVDSPVPPPFVRIRGMDRLDDAGKRVLRELAEVREREAQRADLPPYRMGTDRVLLALSIQKPVDEATLRGLAPQVPEELAQQFVEAVQRGLAAGRLEAEDAAWLEKPRLDRREVEHRKKREKRLTAWRQAEAERRGVSPQVVLPGHCLRRLAAAHAFTEEEISAIEGVGPTRAARYAQVLARLLREDTAT